MGATRLSRSCLLTGALAFGAVSGTHGASDGLPGHPTAPGRSALPEAAAPQVPRSEAGWLARLQEHVAAREYWASKSSKGLQAPSRRHGLRTYFESTGARVHDRTAPGSSALAELQQGEQASGYQAEAVEIVQLITTSATALQLDQSFLALPMVKKLMASQPT